MLPYHIVYPQKRQQNDSEFLHYLSIGSYQTSFTHPNILAFSKITLHPKKHLPKLSYDDLKTKCESEGFKLHKLMIPLYGSFTVDQKHVRNLLEVEVNEKGEEIESTEGFLVKECNFVRDFEYVANKEEKQKQGVFLYILYKTRPSGQEKGQKVEHSSRLEDFSKYKELQVFPIVQEDQEMQISLVEVLSRTKVTLQAQEMLYLQKGKITILQQGEIKSHEMKNKGNRKGEQNYIENMIWFGEKSQVEVEKGSLMFVMTAGFKEK